MKISKKAEYAFRAVLAMSRGAAGTVYSIQSLSGDERIPLKFLEQILLILRKGGVLHSRRGAGGGYTLAKTPQQITIAEVLNLVDGPLDILPGGAAGSFGLNTAFGELKDHIHDWMIRTTIADVLQKEHVRGVVSFEI
jgi:Rrf2 family protein